MDENEFPIVDVLHPRVISRDMNDGTVKVELKIPRLEPSKDKNPKHGNVSLTFFNDGYSFSVRVEIADKKAKTRTAYVHQVESMPTKINIPKSKWTVEKGELVITLVKDVVEPWTKKLLKKGLDQVSSSDSE
ncbi:unnamed protein product [Lymnaea stagnalis]|uniref:CS domain-containing protein n=1 Tax=Lymnaea stagnalis TaxID=6523 RepID=A0AAV2HZD9_LYMST